jgi:hypothetical protein
MTTVNLGNVGDLFKPVDTLIKKIASGAGVLYEPRRIREKAKAEADAKKILALGEIDVDELKQRAVQRFVREELRKQDNMESIISEAIPAVREDAKPQDVEDDWIANFFDKCRLISDEEMQALWAKILAGQANAPGTFSKKTVNLVANLDKSDAQAFTTLCGFAISFREHRLPLIYDPHHPIYTGNGISYFMLSNLESIGLLKLADSPVFVEDNFGRKGLVSYYDQKMALELPEKEPYRLNLGTLLLTESGFEIASVCGGRPVDGFVDYLKERWKKFGYKVEP